MPRRTSGFTHLIAIYSLLLPPIIQNRLQKPASVYIKPKNTCVAVLPLLQLNSSILSFSSFFSKAFS